MDKKTDVQRKAQYVLNRVDMIKTLKHYRKTIEKIALDGVDTEEEHRIAKIACAMIASEFYYEEFIMENKDGDSDMMPEDWGLTHPDM